VVIISEIYSPESIAKYIDHTLLAADATGTRIKTLCGEAVKFGFAAVCVNPYYVSYCAKLLAGSGVKVCAVIGFPLGALTRDMKAEQAAACVRLGANELDMAANIGAAKSGDWTYVEKDIKAVADAAGSAAVKVIIEACLLTDEEKIKMCAAAKGAGARFVKTSTGFSISGANANDVKLIRAAVGGDMGVKAAGGIKSFRDAAKMLNAGANRIGTSSGVKIVSEQQIL